MWHSQRLMTEGCLRVRIIDVMLVEDEKLYFCTARGKEFYHQLMVSDTAITGMNQEYQMVRLNGRARRLEDQKKWIDRILRRIHPCGPYTRRTAGMCWKHSA